jgi:hypothetical protein
MSLADLLRIHKNIHDLSEEGLEKQKEEANQVQAASGTLAEIKQLVLEEIDLQIKKKQHEFDEEWHRLAKQQRVIIDKILELVKKEEQRIEKIKKFQEEIEKNLDEEKKKAKTYTNMHELCSDLAKALEDFKDRLLIHNRGDRDDPILEEIKRLDDKLHKHCREENIDELVKIKKEIEDYIDQFKLISLNS